MVRSGGADAQTMDKQEALTFQFAKLSEREDDAELAGFRTDIFTELFASPHKIKHCRRAVLSDMFDNKTQTSAQTHFRKSTTYMQKIPKEHMRQLLSAMDENLTDATLKSLEKKTPGTLRRPLARMTMTELSGANPWLEKAVFDENMRKRAKDLETTTITIDGDEVNWAKSGFYKLLPEIDSGRDVAHHKFTRVSFLGEVEANLPEWMNVTASWVLEENFSVRTAGIKPPDATKAGTKRKAYSFTLIEAFVGDAEFESKLLSKLPERNDAAGEDGDEDADNDDEQKKKKKGGSEGGVVAAAKRAAQSSKSVPSPKKAAKAVGATPSPPTKKMSRLGGQALKKALAKATPTKKTSK